MDKNIIIIGGSKGIGLASSVLFIEKGDNVFNFSRSECTESRVTNFNLDVSNLDKIKENLDVYMENIVGVDVLVYSAGFSMASPIETVETADYKHLFDVNLFGFIEVVKTLMPYFNQGAHIIAISSIGGVIPIYYDAFYSASKAAINMLVTTMQGELRNHDISITSLMPGGTKTDFTFRRKVYYDAKVETYADDMDLAVNYLFNKEQKGASAEAVAKDIVKIAYCTRPPILASSGFINKFYHFLSRTLPFKWIKGICKMKYFCKCNKKKLDK